MVLMKFKISCIGSILTKFPSRSTDSQPNFDNSVFYDKYSLKKILAYLGVVKLLIKVSPNLF